MPFFREMNMKEGGNRGICPIRTGYLFRNNLSIKQLISANPVFYCRKLCDAQIHNQNKTSDVLIRKLVRKNRRTAFKSISSAELKP